MIPVPEAALIDHTEDVARNPAGTLPDLQKQIKVLARTLVAVAAQRAALQKVLEGLIANATLQKRE